MYNLLYNHPGSDPKGWIGVGEIGVVFQGGGNIPFCFKPQNTKTLQSVVRFLPTNTKLPKNIQYPIRTGDAVIISIRDVKTKKVYYVQYNATTFIGGGRLQVSTNTLTLQKSQATPLFIYVYSHVSFVYEHSIVYFTPTSQHTQFSDSTLVTNYDGPSLICAQKTRPKPNGFWRFIEVSQPSPAPTPHPPAPAPTPHPPAPTPHPPAPTPHPPAPTPHPPAPTPHPPAPTPHPPAPTPHPPAPAPHPPAPTPHPPAPAPHPPAPAPHPPAPTPHPPGPSSSKISSKEWGIIGGVVGGVLLIIVLVALMKR